MIERLSPNHDARPPGQEADLLLLHYTGMPSRAEALARLCDPAARVSAHYLIDEDGTVFRLVAEKRRAWHAGQACWAGERDINGCSIGIELANPGHEWGYRRFPDLQMEALIALAGDVLARHPIAPARVLGHSDVAPQRRQDPGELFDWARLVRAGIGLFPRDGLAVPGGVVLRAGSEGEEVNRWQQDLARYGYDVAVTGTYDAVTTSVAAAFQGHFHPSVVDGRADAETRAALADLLAQIG
jgi:N-acetylmuramoyl-L-alanine amidase